MFLLAGAALPPLSIAQIADICASRTVDEAMAKGDRLGWERADEAGLRKWWDSYAAETGREVEAVGWHGGGPSKESLSFWAVGGPHGLRTCTYVVARSPGLIEALTAFYGPPSMRNDYSFGTIARWATDRSDITLNQSGPQAAVSMIARP